MHAPSETNDRVKPQEKDALYCTFTPTCQVPVAKVSLYNLILYINNRLFFKKKKQPPNR